MELWTVVINQDGIVACFGGFVVVLWTRINSIKRRRAHLHTFVRCLFLKQRLFSTQYPRPPLFFFFLHFNTCQAGLMISFEATADEFSCGDMICLSRIPQSLSPAFAHQNIVPPQKQGTLAHLTMSSCTYWFLHRSRISHSPPARLDSMSVL